MSAKTGRAGGRKFDRLADRFAAEWGEDEGVMGRRRGMWEGGESGRNECRSVYERAGGWGLVEGKCLPHQFTALSPDPKGGKARSELYIRDGALARFET